MTSFGLDTTCIGYTDAATEGTWVWTDGKAGGYEHWSSKYGGQPDNYEGDQNCVNINLSFWQGYWDDIECNKVFNYVCQKVLCPPGKEHDARGKCRKQLYEVFTKSVTHVLL